MDRPPKPERREPYSTPKLTIWGTVEQLTKQVGVHGSLDGGLFPIIRSHI
jgi:hypothetical protein